MPLCRADLHSGKNKKARRRGFPAQMLMGLTSIVIRNRNAAHAALSGRFDHLCGTIASVLGIIGMDVQVEAVEHA